MVEPTPPSSTRGAVSPFRRPSTSRTSSTSPSMASFPRSRAATFGPIPGAPLGTAVATAPPPARAHADPRGAAREALERRRRSGARWFFWVAALSLVNSVATLGGQHWRFIIGLGITQVADALSVRTGHGMGVVALVDAVFIGGFALIGYLALTGKRWAFALGAALYVVDGLIFVAARDWIGVAFHAFVLVMALRGLDAARRLR